MWTLCWWIKPRSKSGIGGVEDSINADSKEVIEDWLVNNTKLNKKRKLWAQEIYDIMPIRFESTNMDVEETSRASTDTDMIINTKMSCDQYLLI